MPRTALRRLAPAAVLLVAVAVAVAGRLGGGLRPAPLPRGDREVAWIAPATSGQDWDKFVIAVQLAADQMSNRSEDGGRWTAEVENAYLRGGVAVPEIVLRAPDAPAALRVRWYKQSSDTPAADWVRALARRDPPPLAVIGGSTSDRARDLATALAVTHGETGVGPILMLTTATADWIYPDDDTRGPDGGDALQQPQRLMHVYTGRTFRICYTNRQIAEAVLDFVGREPDLRPTGSPPQVFALDWADDPYSIDLSMQFRDILHATGVGTPDARRTVAFATYRLPYSVGGYYRPNRREATLAERLLADIPQEAGRRSLLILPATTAPARRMLRALCGPAPLIGRHLVAVAGDAVSLNTVLRDAEFAWNVRTLPVPLVLFAHQNPVAWEDVPLVDPPNGTDEVLLSAELVRRLARAAFAPAAGGGRQLLTDAGPVVDRLREAKHRSGLPVFDADGNRAAGGAYVACLRPGLGDGPPQRGEPVRLSVYRQAADRAGWTVVRELEMEHGRGTRPAGP
jgi:hypothetical protein